MIYDILVMTLGHVTWKQVQ